MRSYDERIDHMAVTMTKTVCMLEALMDIAKAVPEDALMYLVALRVAAYYTKQDILKKTSEGVLRFKKHPDYLHVARKLGDGYLSDPKRFEEFLHDSDEGRDERLEITLNFMYKEIMEFLDTADFGETLAKIKATKND